MLVSIYGGVREFHATPGHVGHSQLYCPLSPRGVVQRNNLILAPNIALDSGEQPVERGGLD